MTHLPAQLGHAVTEEAQKTLLPEAQNWIERRHWSWLIVGIGSGWVIDLFKNLIFALIAYIPGIGPAIAAGIDQILGPLDAMLVAIIPLICIRELSRRVKEWMRR